VAEAAHIRKLSELGYDLENIRRIVKKIGLPVKQNGPRKGRDDSFLTVGHLAERSGVSPRTIKYWEDRGIIEPDMRTEGGFRLYERSYVFLCQLIQDLQLFGYSLEEIKAVSDDVRAFMAIKADLASFPGSEVEAKLEGMLTAVQSLVERIGQLKAGIGRWEDIIKKTRKDVLNLRQKNKKRSSQIREG